MPGSKTRYIAALDGLRAFAVLAVIAYHFGFGWARGGLLGVTVFFVLSGYLITSLLVGEWRRMRTIDLKAFWIRRVKRLIPAIVFLLLCVIVLCGIFNHDLLTKMRGDVPPALFFYSNWWYIFRDVSYFETLGAPSPLTHFWSLAIEEQFYIIWPVLLLVLFKSGTKKKGITRITLALCIVSILLMVFLYNPNADPSRVYYGTDTRAFSLFIGALLAFAWPSNQLSGAGSVKLSPIAKLALDGIGIAAFLGLIVMVVTVDGFSPFMYRGGILLASLLTAVCIAVLVHPQSMFAKAAAIPPLVWTGKRSYGIYLWHYPIMLLMNPGTTTGDPNIFYILLQLVIIFACSAFSYRFIEDPIRKGAIGGFMTKIKSRMITVGGYVRSHFVSLAASSILLLAAIGCFVFIPPVSAVENVDVLRASTEAPPPEPTVDETNEIQPFTVLLIGDSVSVRAIPYFVEMFPQGGIDATVNRPLTDGVIVYEYYRDNGSVGDIVVFSLGTNGPANDEQLDTLMASIGPEKSVYFVNTRSPQPWVQATNEAFSRAAERYKNVSVIDWYGTSANHDDYFDGDGTHLNEYGAQVYVEMIRTACGLPLPEPAVEADTSAVDRIRAAGETSKEKLTLGIESILQSLDFTIETE